MFGGDNFRIFENWTVVEVGGFGEWPLIALGGVGGRVGGGGGDWGIGAIIHF